ncbi:MAG: hypothetical protein ACPG5P_06025, partial [Saprospiraceae bacterium]
MMQYRNKIIQVFSIMFFVVLGATGQETINIEREIKWKMEEEKLSFEDEMRTDHSNSLPLYVERIPIQGGSKISVRLESPLFEEVRTGDVLGLEQIGESVKIISSIVWERRKPYALISFIPLKK